jgi:hypothetical protein
MRTFSIYPKAQAFEARARSEAEVEIVDF